MNWKKLASLALAAALALSLAVPALGIENDHGPVEGPNSTYIPTVEEAQAYVTAKGWMTGTDKGFEPGGEVTRATMYELLWKMEGSPIVEAPTEHLLQMSESLNGILDTWYTNSARWAYREALTTGVEGGRYEGDRVITKAEVLTVLYRYMKDYKKLDVSVEEGWSLEVFADADKIQAWATDAMMWAWLSGVGCQNDSDPTIDPEAAVKRAELAQMLTAMGSIMEEQTRPYTVETVSYESDGRTVPAIVTMPKNVQSKVPAVVLAHGHGGSKDENVGFGGVAAALAVQGIASIRMDFPGCGDSTASFHDNTMTNMIADTLAGVDYLTANYEVDADKLGILGYSMGGRIASEIVGTGTNPFAAVVLLSAANGTAQELAPNMFGDAKTYDDLKATAKKDGFAAFTNVYNTTLELSKEWFEDMEAGKPLTSLAKFEGPVLVLHGDKDTMITDEMNQDNLKACKNGREIVVADADHGYGFYSDQSDVTAAVEGAVAGFFSDTLLGGVSGTVNAVSKYGNIGTDIPAQVFAGAGYEVGDILKITVGEQTIEAPFGTGYSNVDTGSVIALTDTATNTVATAINMGNFAGTYGAAVGTPITYAMGEKAGYLEEYEIRNIDALRTNVREDYESDEVFANFRAVTMGDIAAGKLYRGSSPVNPELGRNTYVDAFLKANNVKTVIDLADSEEEYAGYEGVAASYAYTTNTVKLDMGVDFAAEDFAAKLKTGLEFMIANEGPYFVHCNEGKDRCGFVTMVLEMLMGGKADEIVDDYMLSYENYYGVEHESDRWNRIATSNVVANLLKLTGAEDQAALDKADLVKAAETYLTETVGLTAEQVASLKDVLSK